MRSARGQATLELLAAIPPAMLVLAAVVQLLAAGACRELAGDAAGAGAAALLQDRDPLAAARAALPGWSRAHLSVTVHGRRVRVELRPPALVPGLAGQLRTVSIADAGPRA
ncbi:MAG TPA: hypothetical protein VMT10_01820 [Solirubrobacteraceae bacterium]|nr:hypothetical protein [Solirubrobacteraceae bacterium]